MIKTDAISDKRTDFAWLIWLFAVIMFAAAEVTVMAVELKRGTQASSLQFWFLPLAISAPSVDGWASYRKNKQLLAYGNPAVPSSDRTYQICNLVLVANAAILACLTAVFTGLI